MISRRNFICSLLGAGLGGTTLKLWSSDTPFPEACALRSLKIPGPAEWAGKVALFVTDVHYKNYFGPPEAAVLNEIVRRHKPDLVLMGGDLAQTPGTDISDFLSCWSPGCPTFFAPGNHDMMRSADDRIMSQAREGGMIVLCNEAEKWNGITFVGLPSAIRARQRLDLFDAPGLKIVLGHEPDAWDRYAQASDLLQLAGHTHGGQIRFFGEPLYLPTLGKKYPLGRFFREHHNSLIVGAGIGCTDVPVRINCPPEIIKLEFV
ncbi:MAG: metallophosphoesterase [Verrucomicrobiota bacterium]|nr:metallophosphoesterase [Verrucomicrobiota bacterium]